MAQMGRPRKEIDQQQFENMCAIQCTKEEIAGVFNVSLTTIERWCKETYGETFEGVYKKHSEHGKMSLRRMQFRLAEKNATMAIWLGKQYLGQKDETSLEIKKGIDDTVAEMERYFERSDFADDKK